MSTQPTLSIVIPVRNGMPYLQQAVESVLAHSSDDLEIIVVENFSTDGTPEWLATVTDPRVRVIASKEPVSAGANWSAACAEASGDWVKLLCADDFVTPGGIERQLVAARAHPDAVMIASRRQIVSDTNRVVLGRLGLTGFTGRLPGSLARVRAVLAGANPFGEPSSVLLRREALHASLPFTEAFPYLTDLDMYVKVLAHGDFIGLRSVDGAFRVSGTSWSSAIGARQLSEYEAWLTDMEGKGVINLGRLSRIALALRVRRRFVARRTVSNLLMLERRLRSGSAKRAPHRGRSSGPSPAA